MRKDGGKSEKNNENKNEKNKNGEKNENKNENKYESEMWKNECGMGENMMILGK